VFNEAGEEMREGKERKIRRDSLMTVFYQMFYRLIIRQKLKISVLYPSVLLERF